VLSFAWLVEFTSRIGLKKVRPPLAIPSSRLAFWHQIVFLCNSFLISLHRARPAGGRLGSLSVKALQLRINRLAGIR
jgi:hypothetical protein